MLGKIRPERDGDQPEIERLVDLGFWPGRFAKTAYRLREGVAPDCAPVFRVRAQIHTLVVRVRFWPVRIAIPCRCFWDRSRWSRTAWSGIGIRPHAARN